MSKLLPVLLLFAHTLLAQVATSDGRVLASAPDHGVVEGEPAGIKLERRAPLTYPFYLPAEEQVDGTVAVDIDINQRGEVVDARVLSGPLSLRKAALIQVLNWRYRPVNVPAKVVVRLSYRRPDVQFFFPMGTSDAVLERSIAAPGTVRVASQVQAAKLIEKLEPDYPPAALQARIQGLVKFRVLVQRDGTVGNVSLISGHPVLVPAAQEVIRRHRYQPTYRNGQPVEILTEVDIPFALNP
jgi:TonB family protein